MIFQTHETWEICEPELAALCQPSCRSYKAFEVFLPMPFFLVTLYFKEPNEFITERTFLISSLEHALALTNDDNMVEKSKIEMIYVPHTGKGGNLLSCISQVCKGVDVRGGVGYEITFTDGKTHREFLSDTGELSNLEVLYCIPSNN